MCGRFTLRIPTPVLIEHFGLGRIATLPPRYNIAPTQNVATIRRQAGRAGRRLALVRWGLIPPWATDGSIGNRLINARAETAAEKPSFRAAFRRRRCLVAADGFYEWQRTKDGKQPYYITLANGRPIGFAGLWETWRSRAAPRQVIESCTILTTEANGTLRPIHDRMPVILEPDTYEWWLDPDPVEPDRLVQLLVPCADAQVTARPVSAYVNNPAHDDPHCVEQAPRSR